MRKPEHSNDRPEPLPGHPSGAAEGGAQVDARTDAQVSVRPDDQADALDRADVRAILEHMNDDHADAIVACARAFADETTRRLVEPGTNAVVRMIGIDRRGIDIRASISLEPTENVAREVAGRGARERTIRIDFPEPLATAADARPALVALTRRARTELDPCSDP